MKARTHGAICLGSAMNLQGSYYFMSLTTGKTIKCSKWTELPMPAEVIARVNQLGRADGMTSILIFYDQKGN
jgi:hypothetical protein